VGDNGGNIGVLNLVNDSFQPATFRGPRGAIRGLAYSPDGRSLIASGDDGTAWWWDTVSHGAIGDPFSANLHTPSFGLNLSVDIDPWFTWLLTANTDGLRLWNINTKTWPAIACERAGRNLTPTEWRHYMPSGVPYQEICPAFAGVDPHNAEPLNG
jgi:WD40 repeat protein